MTLLASMFWMKTSEQECFSKSLIMNYRIELLKNNNILED